MADEYADAVMRLGDEVDQACNRALEALSHREIADELRRIAQGWEDSA